MAIVDERIMMDASKPLTSVDPEPPEGSVVEDSTGCQWEADDCPPACWTRVGAPFPREPETWTKVAGNYGPVTVLEWGYAD